MLQTSITKRKIGLSTLFDECSSEQFDLIVRNLKLGNLTSKGLLYWIDGETKSLYENSTKHTAISADDWISYELKTPATRSDQGSKVSAERVYIINRENEQLFNDITLSGSEVNRVLGLTVQGGGQPPKMTPRLYAFLCAWYARDVFPEDPEILFSILENRGDLWTESGVIEGQRGLQYLREFLDALREFEEHFENNTIGSDISFANGL